MKEMEDKLFVNIEGTDYTFTVLGGLKLKEKMYVALTDCSELGLENGEFIMFELFQDEQGQAIKMVEDDKLHDRLSVLFTIQQGEAQTSDS